MNYKKIMRATLGMVGGLTLLSASQVPFADAAKTYDYVVKQGDTLWNISKTHDVDLETLIADNQIKSPDLIHVGQEISFNKEVSEANPEASSERTVLGMPEWQYEVFEMVVQQEAGHNYDSALWVATTILNRVDSSSFPDDIWSVITQNGQFEAYSAEHYLRHQGKITDVTRQAIMDAINNEKPVHPYLFFWTTGYAEVNGRNGENVGGNTYFYW